jgi:Raf kinase inhibitor-like YbhB/YbcL family protein
MRVKLTQVLILAVVVSIVIILTLYIKGIGTGSSIGIYEPNMGLGGFRIMVPIFSNGSNIPSSYACNGVNFTASFPVIISNIPTGTKALMVVMIDIDANMFIHWALIDTPPVNYIPPNLPHLSNTSFGYQLINDFGNVGFNGPCPPSRHMYVVIVYALDSRLGVTGGKYTYAQLVNLIKGHVLATSTWIGYYG